MIEGEEETTRVALLLVQFCSSFPFSQSLTPLQASKLSCTAKLELQFHSGTTWKHESNQFQKHTCNANTILLTMSRYHFHSSLHFTSMRVRAALCIEKMKCKKTSVTHPSSHIASSGWLMLFQPLTFIITLIYSICNLSFPHENNSS